MPVQTRFNAATYSTNECVHVCVRELWCSKTPYELNLTRNCNKIYYFIQKNNNNNFEYGISFFVPYVLVCALVFCLCSFSPSAQRGILCKWQSTVGTNNFDKFSADFWVAHIYRNAWIYNFSYCSACKTLACSPHTQFYAITKFYITQEKKQYPKNYDAQHLWHQPKCTPHFFCLG